MADVFLSYSRQDKARAAQFVELLEDHGWDVFWDQETRAGTLWPKVLEDELNQARCLLVLWTASSVTSRWVRIEAYEALQTDKLLPVRLEKVKPPMEFRQTQAFDLIGWAGERDDPRLAYLIADLCAFAKLEPRKPVLHRADRLATPTRIPPASGEWLATPTISGAPDFTAHRAPTYRSIPGVAVPTLVPDVEQVHAKEAPASPDASAAFVQRPDTDSERIEPVDAGVADGESKPAGQKGSKLWWGLGMGAAAVAAVWIVRTLNVPGSVPSSPPTEPTVVVPVPLPKPPGPDVEPPKEVKGAAIATERSPERTPPKPTKAPRALPARCLEITDKYQTTGQLTAAELQYLNSQECAK